MRNRKRSILRLGKFVIGVSVLSVALAGYVVYEGVQFLGSEFPDVSVLRSRFPVVKYRGPKQSPEMSMSRVRPSGWVALGEISRAGMGAVVVSEDWAFFQHSGYDAVQIKEAIREDLEEGRFARGASTITQQVARNVFLDQDKNLWRKVKELILAVRLEKTVGKRRILETYFNIAEWGEGIFGIGAASQFYFNKAPSALTAKEGAFLAMLLPSPKRYSQSFRKRELTEYARKTVDDILEKMVQAHYLTEDERASQSGTPLSFEGGTSPMSLPDGADPLPETPPELPEN